MPSTVPLQLLPSGTLAAGVASATAIPSAASLTSAGATTTSSVHVPISILSAGSAATAAPEESVSTVCARLLKHVCCVDGAWALCSLFAHSVYVVVRMCLWYKSSPHLPNAVSRIQRGKVSVKLANPQKSTQGKVTKTLMCSEN